jgi:hypothetical protein
VCVDVAAPAAQLKVREGAAPNLRVEPAALLKPSATYTPTGEAQTRLHPSTLAPSDSRREQVTAHSTAQGRVAAHQQVTAKVDKNLWP